MSRRPKGRPPRTRVEPVAGTDREAGWWLLVVVFLAGAALMAYEMVGSRLLAPYFGSSMYVWGSLIAVFLAALSIGYTVGGRLADRFPSAGALTLVLSSASVLVAVSVIVADPLQGWIIDVDLGARANSLVASVLLFGPASVLMGMVSPWAVRLRAGDLAKVGATAGALYGLSTAGSIVGTIAASFYLVQEVGSERTVLTVALTLGGCGLLTAVVGHGRALTTWVAGVAVFLLVLLAGSGSLGDAVDDTFTSVGSGYSPVFRAGGYEAEFQPSEGGRLRAKADSQYHRIRVVDYKAGQIGDERARVMHFDNSLQAAAALDAKGDPAVTGPPLFQYLRAFDIVPAIRPDAQRMLFIGLGSGAAVMRMHELRPDLEIDVVEIDPEVAALARTWFAYEDSENGNDKIHTHIADGRSWLQAQDDAKFDAIILDTYFADSIPFHLTTREFLKLTSERLAPDGVVAANLIGAVEGGNSELLRSMHETWSKAFRDIVVYPVPDGQGAVDLQNFSNVEFIASKNRGVLPPFAGEEDLIGAARMAVPADQLLDAKLRAILRARYRGEFKTSDVPVLTDDLAPVDSLLAVDGI